MQMIGNSWVRGFKRNNGKDEFEGQLPPTTVPIPSPSQEIIIKEILQSIHDPEVGEIGVYGIEGAGKRTIMQHVMCRAQISPSFDTFIAVSIHRNRSTELQKEIVRSLSWSVIDEDIETAARNIPSYLANKKFLLHVHVLIGQTDDPFQFIQMSGVPYPTRQNGCKIVVSTPAYHKSGDRRFVVKGLSMEEAWELFSEKAGEAVNSPHLQPYPKILFVESQMRCKPLRINLLGGAMRNVRDLHLWAQLNQRNAWEFCYDQIPTDEIKNCFSYCSMFPLGHAFYIHELIECWITEGLIDGEDAYKNGLVVLKLLLDRCLLHRVLNDRVTMHATVLEWRNGYPNDKRFTMLSYHMPDWESIKNLTVVMAEKILQCSPQCHNLTFLLIRGSNGIEEIPSSFFEHMPVLRVLKIYETPIRSLPPSLSNLQNLRSLVIRRCPFFRTLPDIRASTLDKLEQLDLSRTAIEALPPWISALTNLQRIILRGCEFFKTLPDLRALEKLEVLDISGTAIKSLPPSISDLCNLQKLLARDCPLLTMVPNLQPLQKLEVLDLLNTPIKEFPEGIFTLVHLRLLQLDQCRFELLEPSGSSLGANMYASDARYIRMFFEDRESAKWLPRFRFNVYPCGGRDALDDIHFQSIQFHYNHVYLKVKYPATCKNYDKSLEVSGSTSSKDDIIAVLDHIESLTLRDYKLLTDLSEMGFENTRGLKDCRLERCHDMESVVSKKEGEDGKMLESLQNLWISNLSSFMSMCAGKVQPGSFACLKQIYLDCCPNLVSVFSSPLTIEKLELIDIRYCDKLENIFAEEIDVECSFPGLKSLLLWELPELKCVCEGILAPPLEKLTVRECPQLKKLPLGFRNVKPPLEIRGSLRWWNDLEWEDDRIKCRILFREWGWF